MFNFSYLRATVTIWNYLKIIAMQLSLTMHKSAMENCKKIKIITNNDNFKKKKNMMNNFEKNQRKKQQPTPTKTILEKNIAVA